MIIDDDQNVIEVLSVLLEGLGFQVVNCHDGSSVLPLVRAERPDLVFTDLVMPGISGLHVIKQIKAEFPDQKIILMSGVQEEEAMEEAMAIGAYAYLSKPISLEKLEKECINVIFGEPQD